MRNIDLDDLEIVHAVIAHGGVARAAQALHRVPSNVTTRIKQLEARLGVALFARRGRGLAPTAEGRLLHGYAERLLRLADETESALRAGRLLGTLRLGSLESTAGSRLPQVLARYNRAHPAVRIELVTGTTAALIARLARHDIEAAFVSEPFCAPGLLAQPVFEEELVLISGGGVAAVSSPPDLGRTTLIAFASGCSYRRRLEEWLAAAGVLPEGVLEFASYPAIVACVAAGTGVAVVPRSVLAGLKAAESVRQHALPPTFAYSRTHLLWHPGQASLALQGLRAVLADGCREAGVTVAAPAGA
ncbi:LysR family transcriptional regulator [Pseudothauera rhizosphaerae]|uniref:LysR family transcriptional regulator n=1 Tax=Pseudothauera rhizosphaerae TaxID=2565932 RepID=A0A4S4A8V6_9RHOO|nr:LysR family transcriptional regulator [Pseudothauera rhizosphaerae]THF54987.1 LysR family transcriptional regulator [Pseudothauera rhizosphaerae]